MAHTVDMTNEQSQDQTYHTKVERLPLAQLHRQIELNQMKERVQQMENNLFYQQKELLDQVEVVKGVIPKMMEKHSSELQHLQHIMQEQQHKAFKERLDLQRNQETLLMQSQRQFQQTIFNQQQELNTTKFQLQFVQLQKQVEEDRQRQERLEQQHKYPTKEETKFDEKVGENDFGNACLICYENKRICVIRP